MNNDIQKGKRQQDTFTAGPSLGKADREARCGQARRGGLGVRVCARPSQPGPPEASSVASYSLPTLARLPGTGSWRHRRNSTADETGGGCESPLRAYRVVGRQTGELIRLGSLESVSSAGAPAAP